MMASSKVLLILPLLGGQRGAREYGITLTVPRPLAYPRKMKGSGLRA
jgi:hypothetical protein